MKQLGIGSIGGTVKDGALGLAGVDVVIAQIFTFSPDEYAEALAALDSVVERAIWRTTFGEIALAKSRHVRDGQVLIIDQTGKTRQLVRFR